MFRKLHQKKLLKRYAQDSSILPQGKGKKVFVGLSGGVDSSVSAAILKYLGYDVEGVFIKVWQPDWMTCTWKEDKRDAMRVAADLDIPFHFLDLSEEYKKEVVDYMIDEYKAGRTPNPDVMCNRAVKFGGFYDWAKKQDSEAYVATGHYATRVYDSQYKEEVMKRGIDKNKDQTYFLWQIRQEQLPSIIFPLGHIPKEHTRELAQYFGLHTESRKDSQGLCFIGHVDMGEFLGHFMSLKEGEVLNTEGKVIGKHKGSEIYTLGQRGGIEFFDKNDHKEPYFVIQKDISKNQIIVSTKKETFHQSEERIILEQCNWRHVLPQNLTAHIRYHGKDLSCKVISHNHTNTELKISLHGEIIAPGQSVVLYDGEICLGGGVIAS